MRGEGPIVRVEPDALKEVGRFGEATSWLSNTTTSSVLLGWLGMVSAYGSDGRVDFLPTGSTFNDVGLLRASDMSHVWGAGERLDEARVRGVGEGWLLGSGSGTATSHTSLALYRLRVTATAGLDPLTGATLGVELARSPPSRLARSRRVRRASTRRPVGSPTMPAMTVSSSR